MMPRIENHIPTEKANGRADGRKDAWTDEFERVLMNAFPTDRLDTDLWTDAVPYGAKIHLRRTTTTKKEKKEENE